MKRTAEQDSGILGRELDTECEELLVGENVTFTIRPMAGLQGTIVEHRERGRVLVQIADAVYVEIQRYGVKKTEAE